MTYSSNRLAWYAHNLGNITNRLEWLKNKPDGILLHKNNQQAGLLVSKQGSQVLLHFTEYSTETKKLSISGIMSRIDIDNPLDLPGTYAQAMMLALALNSSPKRIYMIGSGGGRIPMIFHHYFPELVIDGSEIDPQVTLIAEQYFGLKQDSRLTVSSKDGRHYLNTIKDKLYDIILIDCFTGTGHHPHSLSTLEFYNLCQSRLTKTGVVTTNLIDTDALFDEKAYTFCSAFRYTYEFIHDETHILFGSECVNIQESELIQRVEALNKHYQFTFPLLKRAQEVKALPKLTTIMLDKNSELLHD